MSAVLAVVIAAAGTATFGSGGCRPRGKPFTSERVLGDLRRQYPNVSLPFDPAIPGVDQHLNVVYANRGGEMLRLDLFVPAVGTHPAVIVVHGGGWKSGHRSMEWPFARRLAARGFVTATVGYRLGPAGGFPNALFDLKAAIGWLRGHAAPYRIDPSRIGAVGASAGGQLVALAGATNGNAAYDDPAPGTAAGVPSLSTELAAVVDIDGLANFASPDLIILEMRSPGAPTLFLGGSFADRANTWRAASALHQVGAKSAPTLFIDSTAPTPVLPGRREMSQRLRALGIDSEVVVVPGTPHPFWLVNPWFEPTLDTCEAFLRKHLVLPAAAPVAAPPSAAI